VQAEQFPPLPDADQANAEGKDDAEEGGKKKAPEFGVDEEVLEISWRSCKFIRIPSFGNLGAT
jgi:hypothetical protein